MSQPCADGSLPVLKPDAELSAVEIANGWRDATYIVERGYKDYSFKPDREKRLMSAVMLELLEALKLMEAEKSDYMRINKLGNPAREHTNKLARKAIAKAEGRS